VKTLQAIATQSIYKFGHGSAEGTGEMVSLLGGKGAGLAEMTKHGIPVPPGFTISTDICRYYLQHGSVPEGLEQEIDAALEWLEGETGKKFGDLRNPLLLSVRSGAPVSMPGMMDTILNVGLNDATVAGLACKSGSEVFAYDSYRRLMQMFGAVVLEVPKASFDQVLEEVRQLEGTEHDCELSADALQQVAERYAALIHATTGKAFPQCPRQQVMDAIHCVLSSWNNERAKFYRKLNNISDELGTAVTVQAMVFGNLGTNSGTGVGFTRDPSTGERILFAEFLLGAQGEDIVAGTRTPLSVAELAHHMPEVYAQLDQVTSYLERHFKDVQDFEFTIENGRLYLLQTRSAKRTALAAVKIAVDMANEGLISRGEAVARIKPESIHEILSPQLDFFASEPVLLAQGISASAGAAVGQIALTASEAVTMAKSGPVVLVTEETTAEDIHGMAAAEGFLTARGGATSHAAVVARGMGKCCITGAKAISIDHARGTLQIGSETFKAGDWLSLDGGAGKIYKGRLATREPDADNPALLTLLEWAQSFSTCDVRANADTPEDARNARKAGAVGIGLCRTEHMFFSDDRLELVRKMILASTKAERVEALKLILPMQQSDFEALFQTMAPLPVTIRLLDPPLHEFLPSTGDVQAELAEARRAEDWDRCIALEAVIQRIEALRETNPMMGHRGCRLSLTYPEILEMQVRAILQAAAAVARKEGSCPVPEIMVPLIASEQEMSVIAQMIRDTAAAVENDLAEAGLPCMVEYRVGTMIELPRAALCAGQIAKHVSFVSFGTNDLTQMTFGFSRDDCRSYLDTYLEQNILPNDPFVSIDQEGVGQLIKMAIHALREADPDIKIGVCGEHAGDPRSIRFFKSLGVDYVSCSPSRIPAARLACAN
jgi:pyruvate,orthophosphate dikinase